MKVHPKGGDRGPDDHANGATVNADGVIAAQVSNAEMKNVNYKLQIGGRFAKVEVSGNAVQTLKVQLESR